MGATAILQSFINAAWPLMNGDALKSIRLPAIRNATTGTLREPSAEFMAGLGATPSATGIPINEHTAMAITTAARCVNLVAGTIAGLPFRVHEDLGGGVTRPAPNHPVQQVLGQPNSATTSFMFQEMMLESMTKTGNGIAVIGRSNAFRPIELLFVPPSNWRVWLQEGRKKYEIRYTETMPSGERLEQREIVDQDYILHIAGPGHNGLLSPSPIQMAKDSLGLARGGEIFQSRYLSTGGRPSGVLEFPEGTTVEERDEIRTSWNNYYGGISNAGRTAILLGGVQFKPISFNQADSELLGTRRFQVAEISRIWGVPLFLLNETERTTSWGSGLQEQSTAFVRYTLRQSVRRVEDEYNAKLFREDERGRYFVKVEMDALLRGTSKERAQFYQTMVQGAAVLTPNEARALENLEPKDGGDDLRDPTGAPPQDDNDDNDTTGEREVTP